MQFGTLFEKLDESSNIKMRDFVPLNCKECPKVGDRVVSARGTLGVIIEIYATKDSTGKPTVGVAIVWHSESRNILEKWSYIAVTDADYILVEP